MRISEGFDLFEINGVPYVLPYGQNIADHKKGFRLNESGLMLWKGISEGLGRNDLVDILACHYEFNDDEKVSLREDVDDYIYQLVSIGALREVDLSKNHINKVFTIGNISVNIISPREFIHENFKSFENTDFKGNSLNIVIKKEYPEITENGQILLRNSELWVLKKTGKYILLFPQAEQILEGHLDTDGKNASFYIRGNFSEKLKEDLFHAIRLMYLYRAQINDMYVVHSASILYKNKVWLFSAASGVGKSTHTNLWYERFNTPIVNGDLNMLAIEEGMPVVHGIPWCGTSGIYDTKTYPLGGIVFLRRGDVNVCEELGMEEKALSLMQRMISPAWSKEMVDRNLRFAETIAAQVPVCRLNCNMEPEAAKMMKQWIDNKEND